MNKELLVVFIDSLVNEAVSKIKIPEPIQGPRGPRGRNGNSFNLDDYREEIKSFILENIPKLELTEEQIESLRGPKGDAGSDGKDFNFSDHEEEIRTILQSAKISFDDLTQDQIESIRGPKGKDGKNGTVS